MAPSPRLPRRRRRRRHPLGLIALLLGGVVPGLSGCADRQLVTSARAVMQAYQDAVFSADRVRLRALLSIESRELLPHLPLERTRGLQRLEVVAAELDAPRVLVTVVDPNQDHRRQRYVLVREHGELRLDLLATTAYHNRVRALTDGETAFVPAELPSSEIARIRSQQGSAFR